MSGDVQPRKRKDKRKKKEGTSLGNIHEPITTQKFKVKSFDEDLEPTPVIGSIDAGEKIHVHNDHGIGGNICVKIIFFCLLGALVAAVGIIFIHSRGSTDVDLPSVEDSRFADYFTGWLDDATDDHGHDEHELAHGDDDGHDEEDEHGGGEEEEHSGEEGEERSEEEEHGGDAAEEGSPEAGDNEEEENADDDDEDDDERGVDEDDDEPKFKVVHRFKHFFNQRKRFVREKSEESDVRKRKKVVDVADDDDDDDEEVEKEEEEEEDVMVKRSDLRMKRKEAVKKEFTMRKRSRKEEEVKDSVMRKRSRKEIEAEDEDEDEDDEEEEEESKEEVKETDEEEDDEDDEESEQKVEDEDEDDEEEEESDEKVQDEDEEDEEEEEEESGGKVKKADEEDEDDEKEEESGEKVKEEDEEGEDDEEEEESGEKVKEGDDDGEEEEASDEKMKEGDEEEEESDEKVAETDEEDKDDDDSKKGEDDEDKSPEVDLGLDEIDESEEALKEEERIVRGGRKPPSSEEDKELEEVESKIIDIEEKLNQILREKRKEVEQRKMELEEIEIESVIEETREEEVEGVEGGEEDEESNSHGVAVKVIVGIALIVVAHLVLIKKWNSLDSLPPHEKTEIDETKEVRSEDGGGDDEKEPVISRRQTLVPEAADLNEYFPDEGDEETGEEEEEEEEEEEDEDVEEEEEEEYSEEEELMVKDDRKWTVDYPNRMTNLTRDEEEYTDEEEEVEDEEEVEEEEEEEEEEDVEEDDYGWKRLEPARMEIEEEEADEVEAPPIPPPRRSHMTSGERRGGPQGIDDFPQMNEAFEELWDGFDTVDEGEEKAPSGEREEEEKAEDEMYKEEFRFAEDQLDNNPTAALKKYELILSRMPESVKALMGRAKALDKIAEKERSNQYLREAINAYRILLTKHEEALTDGEFLSLSERCIDRMRFRGYFKSAIEIHKGLIKKFPDNPKYRNDLAVTYLFLNDIKSARSLLEETLKIWPKNGFALVHYGFVLKTADSNHAEAVDYLMAGIRTREPGVIDGRFFFHLGDALNRLGRGKEAMEWYDRGVKEGLFLSKYQRSLYNVDRLKAQPWWTHTETTYQDFFKKLEDNWEKIRSEGLSLLNSKGVNLFKEEAENLKDTGDWRQLDLYFRGTRHSNCDRAPFTCSLIASFRPASSCTRGQVKFSVMLPSTHVWPHCGPTNCRLRSHLGLLVPKNTFIRVAEETRSWEEGKVIIFDDSFEHEVWHNGTGVRLVLIVDVWHPELTAKERSFLSPI